MNLNMTAADIVRDADLMPLYKAAGIEYIVTGVEALEDGVIKTIHKNNPFEVSNRNQVIATSLMKPLGLFLAVKLTEILYHLRPRAMLRLWKVKDRLYRRIMWASLIVGVRVVIAEILEFLFDTKFSPRGTMESIPGSQSHLRSIKDIPELPVL